MVKQLISLFILLSCLVQTNCVAQTGLKEGDVVQNLAINRLLNSSKPLTSLAGLSNKITVIDFFGTWCGPCLKALPHLNQVKNQFKDELNIVLVSNEAEAQLTKFISARKDFAFPVIVDVNNKWNNLFQPPSLPYTVVVNGQGKLIAITKGEEITPAKIEQWVTSAKATPANEKRELKTEDGNVSANMTQKSSNQIIRLSQDYIYSAKVGESLDAINSKLKAISFADLISNLRTDNLKKAFWINLYNGYTQAALKANPDKYKNRSAFFKSKQIDVAGNKFSLDEIEHGILRHSKIKWSLGHFNKLFPSKKEKKLRVDRVDYRIHFALNCGAKSCPPIAFYNPDNLDQQLDLATRAYLSGEAEYDSSKNILRLPKLMSWFRADFGGKKGMVAIAKKNNIISNETNPKIKFKDYDWTLTLNNYKTYE
jgi:thiol-disulfide isomerase/thioredoxin